MNKYVPIVGVGILLLLILFSYLAGKLYHTQQELIKCKMQNLSLESHLSLQNSKILEYQSKSNKSILDKSEALINSKYDNIKAQYDSCQSVLNTYIKLLKD